MMTEAETIAEAFKKEPFGKKLLESDRYFRFSIESGMDELRLDECDQMQLMIELADNYLGLSNHARSVKQCATALLAPSDQCRFPP